MTTDQKLLYKTLSNFEGLSKLEAYDLLHKMEVLLYYTTSSLRRKQLKQIIVSNLDAQPNEELYTS